MTNAHPLPLHLLAFCELATRYGNAKLAFPVNRLKDDMPMIKELQTLSKLKQISVSSVGAVTACIFAHFVACHLSSASTTTIGFAVVERQGPGCLSLTQCFRHIVLQLTKVTMWVGAASKSFPGASGLHYDLSDNLNVLVRGRYV